jgi:hypothetical protein
VTWTSYCDFVLNLTYMILAHEGLAVFRWPIEALLYFAKQRLRAGI